MASQLTDLLPTRSAYLRPSTVRSWGVDELQLWLDVAAKSGVEALVTKTTVLTPDVVSRVRAAGLRVVASFTCFSDHDASQPAPETLRPVDSKGARFAPMEWYTGIIPTSQAYANELAASLDTFIESDSSHGVEGIVLDFIRWPGHWELESRTGASLRESSFDPISLTGFQSYLDDLPDEYPSMDTTNPLNASALIEKKLRREWHDYKCQVVTSFAARLSTRIHDSERWSGAFLVPVDREPARADFGQDWVDLAQVVDVLAPMTYHAMLGQPASWPVDLGRSIAHISGAPALVMAQLSADVSYAGGYDWGHSDALQVSELGGSINTALQAGELAGTILFPGEAILDTAVLSLFNTRTTVKGKQ